MNKALMKAIKICQTKKTTLQVLYRFAIRGGVLHLTDLEQTLLATGLTEPDGLYVTDIFAKSGSLDLSREAGVDLAEFPDVPKVEKATAIDAGIFDNMSGFTDFASEDFSTRVTLTGVCLQKDALVATDGHSLLSVKFPRMAFDGEIIIPRRAWMTLEKLKKVSWIQYAQRTKTELIVVFTDFSFITKLVEGPYPDFERAVPSEFKKTTKLSAKAKKDAAEALKKVKAFVNVNGRVILSGDFVYVFNTSTGIKAKARMGGKYWEDVCSFDCHYLLKCFAQFPGDVTLKTNKVGGAVMLEDASGKMAILMPIRHDGEDPVDAEYTEVK